MESKFSKEGARTKKGGMVEEVGIGFGVSAAVGFAYYLVKGFSSGRRSFNTAFQMACLNGARIGCAGGAFAAVTYSMTAGMEYFRQKNDKLNVIAASAAGGAAINARHGIISASCSAIGIAGALTLINVWDGERRKKKRN